MKLIDTYPWGPPPPTSWLMTVAADGRPADSIDDLPTGTDQSGHHAVWYRNGKLHRDGGPAFIWSSQPVPGHTIYVWWQNGEPRNPDGPTVLVLPRDVPYEPVAEALRTGDRDFPYPPTMRAEWTVEDGSIIRAGGPAIYCPAIRRIEWREPDGVGHRWTGEEPIPGPHDSWLPHINNTVRFSLNEDEEE